MTISADNGVEVVTPADVAVIAQDVWMSFLDMSLEPAAAGAMAVSGQTSIVGAVTVSDGWRGMVVVECSPALAVRMAAAMFGRSPAEIGEEEIRDSLGEMTNMVGGNVKSLLPAPSHLSLPRVVQSVWPTLPDGSALVCQVPFLADGVDPVSISIWRTVAAA